MTVTLVASIPDPCQMLCSMEYWFLHRKWEFGSLKTEAKTVEPRLVTTIWLLYVNKTSVYSWFRTFPTVYRIVCWFSISQTLPIIIQLLKLPAQTFSLESLLELWQSRGYHDSILSLFRNELRHQKLPSWNWNKKFRVYKWVTEMTHHHLRMSENVNNWII